MPEPIWEAVQNEISPNLRLEIKKSADVPSPNSERALKDGCGVGNFLPKKKPRSFPRLSTSKQSIKSLVS